MSADTNSDRRTKAQILDENARLESELASLKASAPAPRRFTPEADALDKCINALTSLKSNQTSYGRSTDGDVVGWVLDALASRFKKHGY